MKHEEVVNFLYNLLLRKELLDVLVEEALEQPHQLIDCIPESPPPAAETNSVVFVKEVFEIPAESFMMDTLDLPPLTFLPRRPMRMRCVKYSCCPK